jgi:hypothetical protein
VEVGFPIWEEAGGAEACLPFAATEKLKKIAIKNKVTLYHMARNLHPIQSNGWKTNQSALFIIDDEFKLYVKPF